MDSAPPDLDALMAEAQKLQDSSVALSHGPARPEVAPTMGKIRKISYTHDALIDQIIANPQASQGQLAALFGYSPAWVSNIMAADAFQARLAERRRELIDPTLLATVDERIRGMVIQSLDKIQRALEAPACKPEVALRAFELGAKGLGIGGNAPPRPVPVDLDALAQRLTALNSPRDIPGEVLAKEVQNG